MKKRYAVMLLGALALAACDDQKDGQASEPKTPQEMYERARYLLKPNVEKDESDFAGALEYLKKAAEGGWPMAEADLGSLYLYGGRGLAKDENAAVRWLQRAAEHGSAEGHAMLGLLYYEGMGLAKDVGKAMAEWRVAAEANIPAAQYRLGHLLSRDAASAEEGIALLKMAALSTAGRVIAQAASDLGYIYARGSSGVPADAAEAAKWYAVAASAGDPHAAYICYLLYASGSGVEKDSDKALQYLRLSAGQDYPAAIQALVALLRRSGTPETDREAEAWLQRLIELQKKQKSQDGAEQGTDAASLEKAA